MEPWKLSAEYHTMMWVLRGIASRVGEAPRVADRMRLNDLRRAILSRQFPEKVPRELIVLERAEMEKVAQWLLQNKKRFHNFNTLVHWLRQQRIPSQVEVNGQLLSVSRGLPIPPDYLEAVAKFISLPPRGSTPALLEGPNGGISVEKKGPQALTQLLVSWRFPEVKADTVKKAGKRKAPRIGLVSSGQRFLLSVLHDLCAEQPPRLALIHEVLDALLFSGMSTFVCYYAVQIASEQQGPIASTTAPEEDIRKVAALIAPDEVRVQALSADYLSQRSKQRPQARQCSATSERD